VASSIISTQTPCLVFLENADILEYSIHARWNSKRLRCYWTTIIMASTAGEVECDRCMIRILIHCVVNWNCLHRPLLHLTDVSTKILILYHHPISLRHQRFQPQVEFGKKLCPFRTEFSASHRRHAPRAVASAAASRASVRQSMALCNDLANLIDSYTRA